MEIEDLIKKVESIKDLKKDYKILYEVMDELGIKFKKTTCSKCRRDYLNIVKEELGLITDAALMSAFDDGDEWIYLHDRSYSWTKLDGTKVIINKNTPREVIEEFVKTHKGFYKKIEKHENNQ